MANPYFNATYYLANNPDVFAAGINTAEGAWAHYEQYGAAEALNGVASRSPAPWFDIVYYRAENPDLNTAGLTAAQLFSHFTEYGLAEGRSPSAAAEAVNAETLAAYAAANEDLREAFGIEEGEEPTEAQLILLAKHFYEYGYNENREGLPVEFNDNPGSTFTLTTDVDNFVGTSGDDIFQAKAGGSLNDRTLNQFDSVDGGSGIDTMNIISRGNADVAVPTGATIKNVEIINIINEENNNVNAAGFQGAEQIWQVAGRGNISGLAEGVTAGFRAGGATVAADATVTAAAGASSVAIALDGVTSAGIMIAGDDVETVSVSGSISVATNTVLLNTTVADTDITTLNLALTSNSLLDVSNLTDLESIDASGSTGNFGTAAASVDLTDLVLLESYVGSQGRDFIDVALDAEIDRVVDLGAGNDQITIDGEGVADGSLTITLGAGSDLVTFENELSNIVDASEDNFMDGIISITDFNSGARGDVLDVALVTGAFQTLLETELAQIDAADDLFEALGLAASFLTGGNDSVAFDFAGNAYILVSGDNAFSDDDGLIELVGVSVEELGASNFVV